MRYENWPCFRRVEEIYLVRLYRKRLGQTCLRTFYINGETSVISRAAIFLFRSKYPRILRKKTSLKWTNIAGINGFKYWKFRRKVFLYFLPISFEFFLNLNVSLQDVIILWDYPSFIPNDTNFDAWFKYFNVWNFNVFFCRFTRTRS